MGNRSFKLPVPGAISGFTCFHRPMEGLERVQKLEETIRVGRNICLLSRKKA